MAATTSVTVFLLCFSATCEARVLKRQSYSDCESRTDPCSQNVWVITNLFRGEGFDSLVVDGHFALQCSGEDSYNPLPCLQNIDECPIRYRATRVNRVVKAYEYMCDNGQEFEDEDSCWKSGPVGNTLMACQDQSFQSYGMNYCSLADCLEENIVNIPGCTAQAAYLFANICRAALRTETACPDRWTE